jgi:hypothetical protein
MVRSNNEPRSNSPVIGNLPTNFWRARMVRSRIIHKNESAAATNVNAISSDLAVFPSLDDSRRQPKPIEFCAGK